MVVKCNQQRKLNNKCLSFSLSYGEQKCKSAFAENEVIAAQDQNISFFTDAASAECQYLVLIIISLIVKFKRMGGGHLWMKMGGSEEL